MTKFLDQFKGDAIYVIMARYAYAGVLVDETEDIIRLASAHAIEDAGSGIQESPRTATPCGSSVVLLKDAIETICQPVWVHKGAWSQVEPEKQDA